MTLNLRVIFLFVSALFIGLLAAFVFWRYRRSRLSRIFSINAFCVAGYALFLAGLGGIQDQSSAQEWLRATSIFAYGTVLSYFYFCVVFSKSESRLTKSLFYGAAVIFGLDAGSRIFGLMPTLLEYHGEQGWFPAKDFVYQWIYSPVTTLLLFGGLFFLVGRRLKSKSAFEKNQLSFFLMAMAANVIFSMSNVSPRFSFLGSLGPVSYVVILAYAITRHRLLDISLLVKKGAVAAGVAILVALSYVLAILLGSEIWGTGKAIGVFAAFLTALVMAFAYDPLKTVFFRGINRVLGIREINPSKRLLDYAMLLSVHPGMADYLDAVVRTLSEDLEIHHSVLFLRDKVGTFAVSTSFPYGFQASDTKISSDEQLIKYLSTRPLGVDLDDLTWTKDYEDSEGIGSQAEREQLLGFFSQLRAQMIFPLLDQDQLLGVLACGSKNSGRVLSPDEFQFLSALCMQISTAIQNHRLHGQVQQAERLSTLGTLSASLAHELRNPLTSISTFVQVLPMRYADEKFREKFVRIVGLELAKLTRLTEQLLTFSRPTSSVFVSQEMFTLCDRVRQLLRHQFSTKGVELRLEGTEGDAWASVNEAEFSQVLINLLLNALQATESGGQVTVIVLADGDWVQVSIRDSGSGMTPEQMRHIFDPFYTTKETGTGLGLPTCQRIVDRHQGKIELESLIGKGTCFKVTLKASKPLRQVASLAA